MHMAPVPVHLTQHTLDVCCRGTAQNGPAATRQSAPCYVRHDDPYRSDPHTAAVHSSGRRREASVGNHRTRSVGRAPAGPDTRPVPRRRQPTVPAVQGQPDERRRWSRSSGAESGRRSPTAARRVTQSNEAARRPINTGRRPTRQDICETTGQVTRGSRADRTPRTLDRPNGRRPRPIPSFRRRLVLVRPVPPSSAAEFCPATDVLPPARPRDPLPAPARGAAAAVRRSRQYCSDARPGTVTVTYQRPLRRAPAPSRHHAQHMSSACHHSSSCIHCSYPGENRTSNRRLD